MSEIVNAWQETVEIATYPVGQPEKNPMFLEKRVYQGSSGVVYPHAVIEKISDEKINKSYQAVFMENEYIKIMILPELGGRIQMAFDKVKQRHFVYYNQVIKPALVGLTGPWISGGIEFNWPQHHRPSTFEPVDFAIVENEDGSKTVWVNEVERMFRTKGMAGFTLYPGKAFIEIKGRIYNRTPLPQTFLWWANPAVKAGDDYQSIFPPDVSAVFDHGKRDVSSFPIAKGTYYKVDYAPGTDISKYKNIPVPTSFMAVSSKYNFIGGYEHDTQGGLLHIADHYIAPGKKQWTWGHSEFGRAWDKNLTDEDGPYIELMTGVYTDNQPDFTWLQPYEEKTFSQYFMPYRDVGIVKNASKEAVINIECNNTQLTIKLYVTAIYKNLEVTVYNMEQVIFSENTYSSPLQPFIKTIPLHGWITAEVIKLVVKDADTGKELVSYQKDPPGENEIPAPAKAALPPHEIENNEQLFLTGLHLEQYRHATFAATDYYEEALKRDPKDIRNNNAMGLWNLRRGQFAKAEYFFRQAITTLTQRNPNPYDGELFYNLGWALKLQHKTSEAFDAFYKSVWNDAWQHAGYFELARIATLQNNIEAALGFIEKALVKNVNSHTARHAHVFILRKLNKKIQALSVAEAALTIDPFNFGCLFEKYLLLSEIDKIAAHAVKEKLLETSRNWVHNFIEYALDYAQAGLYSDASALLLLHQQYKHTNYSLIPYYLGWLAFMRGDIPKAVSLMQQGATLAPRFVFPNRLDEVVILQTAIQLNPGDAKAYYYLGNFWYDKRQYKEAIECWEKSAELEPGFPTVLRNLALAYYNKCSKPQVALKMLEKAFAADTTDARVLMELDQLYKKLNTPHKKRLEFLEQYPDLILQRDDLYLERVTLHNQLQQYTAAQQLLAAYKFHPWEGGEGKVVGQYLTSHIELAKEAIIQGLYMEAMVLLNMAGQCPDNLGEGKLFGVQENDIDYWKGVAYEQLGETATALDYYGKATTGISEPVQAIFYNDPAPDKIFYQGLAWEKTGNRQKATEIFQRLIAFGEQHMEDQVSIDYFAVSLPDLLVFDADLGLRNKIHCMYLKGLGYLGMGSSPEQEKALTYFNNVLQLDINHQGAFIHKKMITAQLLVPVC